MSLVIRFSKIGRKGERKYRLVVKEKRSNRDGEPVDTLGFYEKTTKDVVKEFNMDRVNYWISKGAKLTPSVDEILHPEKKILKVKKEKTTKAN